MTPAERENPVHLDARRRFDAAINLKLGPNAAPSDFDKSHVTPEFEKYFDDNNDGSPRMPEAPVIEIEPTPEVGDNYVNVEIMLPRGSTEQRGRVISRKRDSDGHPIGNANDNPILDSRRYKV